jgi:hypothetical protein
MVAYEFQMLTQYSDIEIVILCINLVQALSKSDLVFGCEFQVVEGVSTTQKNFRNAVLVSWGLPKAHSVLASPLHYFDEDGERVDLNISKNDNSQVVEVELWKYADKEIIKFPSIRDLQIQEI